MKFNPEIIINNIDGKPVMRGIPEDGGGTAVPWTIRTVCIEALMSDANPAKRTGLARYEAYRIARLVHDAAGTVDLKAEDVTLIKEAVGIAFPPVIVGPAFDILDGK